MMHFGHANALRQARILGDELLLGIHSDAEVEAFKGPPTLNQWERYEAARGCKWVTYVVENAPYVTRLEDMRLLEVDYVVHGDDISTDQFGNNSYQAIIDAGLFKVVKRTDGISTTDLVGRMLLCTKSHHDSEQALTSPGHRQLSQTLNDDIKPKTISHYLTTSRKIVQFSNNCTPKPTDKVVYVDGAFDLFHCGHLSLLKAARMLGDYVVVGVHEDHVVNQVKGANYPIMNTNERVLGVLSCKYVDEVVMGVPYVITEDLIKSLGVHVVVHGQVYEGDTLSLDAYAVPRAMGLYKEVDTGSDLTTDSIIRRIVEQRQKFEERNAKKSVKDKKVEENKPEQYRNVREVS
jgi:ethanolamine-phosphate cytidylyltransferase